MVFEGEEDKFRAVLNVDDNGVARFQFAEHGAQGCDIGPRISVYRADHDAGLDWNQRSSA